MKRFSRPLVVIGFSIVCVAFIASGLFFTQASDKKNAGKRDVGVGRKTTVSSAPAAPFGPGNLVIYRVGDGSAALSGVATAVFLDEYTPAGTLVQSIAMPVAASGGNNILTAAGSSTSEGFLSRSADGSYLVLGGYNKAPGGSAPNSDVPATTGRVIGRVDAAGAVNTSTILNDPTGNVRGVASSDGINLWLTSSSNGIRHAAFGSSGGSTQLSTTVTNLRVPFVSGGQLYVSTSSGSAVRIGTVGTGLPTTSGQTISNLSGIPTTGAPYAYFLADLNAGVAGDDTLYVADDGAGTITKYSLVSDVWTSNGSVTIATARGLAGSVNGSSVSLFVTNGTAMHSLTDTAGYNAAISGTPASVATATANTAFRGIAFAPGSGGPSPTPTSQKANVDMNGDGRTDFVITRESSSFAANALDRKRPASIRERMRMDFERRATNSQAGGIPAEWWGVNNGAPGGTYVVWGDAVADFIISADFDGDDHDDVAIWRPGPPEVAAFYSINSIDLTYRVSAFGQFGDNPTVVGDYDGDGKDDSATFRCPPTGSGAGQCYFFYRGTLDNPTNGITYIPWGFGETFDFFPYPGDFDGDGKHDFCLQAVNPDAPLQAIFLLQLNDAASTQEYIHWGYSTDFLAPGDYDGDGKSDFCVVRNELGRRVFYILHRTGSVRAEQWGFADDDIVPGDYDGDGKQDIAIYRWNASDATFWILPSNGDPHFTFNFGIPGDVPVAKWYVQ